MLRRYIWALYLTRCCNLGCSYCYCGGGLGEGEMDRETALQAVRFLLEHSRRKGADSIDIGFFGREPLLKPDLVEFLIGETRGETGVTYSLNTNGTLLNSRILKILRDAGVKIALSLDGPSRANDSRRKSEAGESVYGKVFRMFPELLAYEPPVHIRMTVAAAEAGNFCENAVHLLDVGFRRLSFAFDLTDPLWGEGEFADLRASMHRFAEWYAGAVASGRDLIVPAFDSLAKGRAVPSCGLFCGAASNLFSIDCDGAVYPCWRFAGDPEWKMGDIRSGFTKDPESHPFNSIRQKEIAGCRSCPYAGFCGRCAWAGIKRGGRPDFVSRVLCETSKAAMEAGLEACRRLLDAHDPHFLARLDAMRAEEDGEKMRLVSDNGNIYSILKEELEKYRVR